jgi:hypothetical protein
MNRTDVRTALNTINIKPRQLATIAGLSIEKASSLARNREPAPFWFEVLLRLLVNAAPELLRDIQAEAAQQTEWRRVPGFPAYEVSDAGEMRRPMARGTKDMRILKYKTDRAGYKIVGLYSETGKQHWRQVHRLVCLAFHGLPKPGRHYACHKNGIKADVQAINLYWGSASDNARDTVAHRILARKNRGTFLTQKARTYTSHHPEHIEFTEECET